MVLLKVASDSPIFRILMHATPFILEKVFLYEVQGFYKEGNLRSLSLRRERSG